MDFRFVSQKLPGHRDVGKAVTNVAYTRLEILGSHVLFASQIFQLCQQFIQRYARTVRDVDDFTDCACGVRSIQVCRDYVLDVSEVARLFAVAVDHRTFVTQQATDKTRNYARVLRTGILPWSKHIEVTQGNSFQTVN